MKKFKIISAVGIGNFMEWYDFQIVVYLYSVLATKFFPGDGDIGSKMASILFAFFGYSMRPFGALLFSYIGDYYGRINSLFFSIITMAIASIIIGFMPGYNSIGYLATVLFLIARIMQGMSLGAETSHAYVYVLELFKKDSNNLFYSSFLMCCSSLSFGFSGLMAWYVTANMEINPDSNIWRLPFLIGAGIAVCGIYMRKTLTETYSNNTEATNHVFKNAIDFVLKNKSMICALMMLFGAEFVVGMYAVHIETIISDEILGQSGYNFVCIGYFTMFFFPLLTYFYKPKNKETVIKKSLIALSSSIPLFLLSWGILVYFPSKISIFISTAVSSITFALIAINCIASYYHLFPKNIRCACSSFLPSIAISLLQITVIPAAMYFKYYYNNPHYLPVYIVCFLFTGVILYTRYINKAYNKNNIKLSTTQAG